MRVDLILQSPHISFLLAFLRKRHFLKQVFDPDNHPVEVAAEHSDFIVIFGRKPDIQVTMLHLLHQANHRFQRFGQRIGNECRYNQSKGYNRQGGQNQRVARLLHRGENPFQRYRNYGHPPGFR
ncbi:hypothetical protein D3C75_870480 [compost metagenome]